MTPGTPGTSSQASKQPAPRPLADFRYSRLDKTEKKQRCHPCKVAYNIIIIIIINYNQSRLNMTGSTALLSTGMQQASKKHR